MHTKFTIAIAGFFLIIASAAYAQSVPPSNVTGVKAVFDGANLTASWDAATDASGIAYYRVYFSRASIMDNGGDYDDFEQTTGPVTSYTFSNLPYHGATLYLSVLAVNTQGVESEAFAGEASVDIPAQAFSSSSSIELPPIPSLNDLTESSESSISMPSMPLTLIGITAISSTGITLSFSESIAPQSVNPQEIVIIDGSGSRLSVRSAIVMDATIMITTDQQYPEKHYLLAALGANLQGTSGARYVAPVQPTEFLGFGFMATPPLVPVVDTTPPADPVDMMILPMARADGMYDVRVHWVPGPDAGDTASFMVMLTSDGLTNFGTYPVAANSSDIQFTSVPAGPFGVKVVARDAAGNASQGLFRLTTLESKKPLSQTGVGLLGVSILSGAIAGRRLMKKRAS